MQGPESRVDNASVEDSGGHWFASQPGCNFCTHKKIYLGYSPGFIGSFENFLFGLIFLCGDFMKLSLLSL